MSNSLWRNCFCSKSSTTFWFSSPPRALTAARCTLLVVPSALLLGCPVPQLACPSSRSSAATSGLFSRLATSMGRIPLQPALRSAPADRSSFTTPVWPCVAAANNAVAPSRVLACTFALRDSIIFTIDGRLSRDAIISGVQPSASLVSTSTPISSSLITGSSSRVLTDVITASIRAADCSAFIACSCNEVSLGFTLDGVDACLGLG
mmetsp:Transcript_4401/g.9642  ORF Transcript_4401/g.9642 Transcript_4401/m.9642 type:complete len:206 (+) Transcript_4401:159-776(+)